MKRSGGDSRVVVYPCVAGKAVLGVLSVLGGFLRVVQSTAEGAEDAEEQRDCERATHHNLTTDSGARCVA